MVTNLGIKNFRSFDDNGIFLLDLSKVNIIIGKNNSGKSNILRFLNLLSPNISAFDKFPSKDKINGHKKNGNSAAFGFDITFEELGWPEMLEDLDLKDYDQPLSKYISDPFRAWVVLENERFETSQLPEKLSQLDDRQFKQLHRLNRSANSSTNLETITDIINELIRTKIKEFRDLIYVPDLRFISPSSQHNSGNSKINGVNIIQSLFKMQHPNVGDEKEREIFEKIQTLVGDLLNIANLKIEIPHAQDVILVIMHGNRLPLDSYGSGIYQLILLCSALVIYEDRWICIEEPESHLHPELQRKFLDFLVKETKNKYLITTHSNIFINYSSNISIYHMEHNADHSSLYKVENSRSSYSLLNDLGYKASDLLQANGVIWVEGPSDRNYILKWISLLDASLEEGLHFSIMFYGGKNLANVSFDEESYDGKMLSKKLIPLLKINRNAIVVIDSDIITGGLEINKTKKRIQNEIGDDNCWITKGKEIENYINKTVIEKWLTERGAFNNNSINFTNNLLFKDIVNSMDATGKIDYDAKKTLYSSELSRHFLFEDLGFNELDSQLHKLVNLIKQWNHLA